MATVITNQAGASALKGQNPVVILSAADAENVDSSLVGHTCTTSTGNTGRVAEVFFGGVQIIIAPNNMGSRFDSNGSPGILAIGETITIN